MKSYAQDKEDIILRELLPGVDKGHYIDVGANDPEALSVTKAFYDEGWTGVNIEPLPDVFAKLNRNRLDDINICAALGSHDGIKKLYIDGFGSSLNELEGKETIEVPVWTLSKIYRLYCKEWDAVHFCKIDVEGYEKEVLKGIEDWEEFRPWIYCIEATLPGTYTPCHDRWEYILLEHDYELVKAHGINRYYRDARRAERE